MSEKRPLFRLRNVIQDAMHDDKNYLLGKVLTHIDASIADPIQRKALKDVIQESFWETNGRGWLVAEALKQFADKFCEEKKFISEDSTEEKEFLGKDFRYGSPRASASEDYFPNS